MHSTQRDKTEAYKAGTPWLMTQESALCLEEENQSLHGQGTMTGGTGEHSTHKGNKPKILWPGLHSDCEGEPNQSNQT